jgi:ribosomal protein S21
MANAEVTKNAGENALSLIRKFTRRVQGTGLVKTVRAGRYHERSQSKAVQKKKAIKRIKRRVEYNQLVKEGKVVETVRRGFHQQSERPQRESAPASKTGLGEATPIAR